MSETTGPAVTALLRRKKVLALLAGGLVLGIGATATLAAWTDSEWVFGGNETGNGPGIGTSSFEVEQNVTAPYSAAGASFLQDETNPGQDMLFGIAALSLTPGDSVYAPVALRTVAGSIGGTVLLSAAVAADETAFVTPSADANGYLLGALTLRVAVVEDTVTTCDATAFGVGADIIVTGALATAAATVPQSLTAESGNVQHYCFEVTLPTVPTLPVGVVVNDLQGLSIAPAWEFAATSD